MNSTDPHAEPETPATGHPAPATDTAEETTEAAPPLNIAESETGYVPSGSDYVSNRDFADFPISPEMIRAIHDLGFRAATPVQAATIEPALAGKDLLVRAKTGTGKTAAFAVPILERIADGERFPKAIILAPTRELAQQIADDSIALSKYRDCTVATLVGGMPMGPQERALSDGAALIVGTPGRVLDHLRRGSLSFARAEMVCLDEADEMLSMGFYEDVTKILDAMPAVHQTLLFSATISPQTERLIAKYLHEPEQIRLSTDADQVQGIEHVVYETPPNQHKVRSLLYLLDMEDPTSAIIFCNTREDTSTVASFLDRQGLDTQLLSGELPQSRRNKVMKQVKAGAVRFLVATDVAARGIDISDLSHVIQYSLPQDPAVYLHRTGRTGRIGKKGTAISLISGSDIGTKRVLASQHQIQFVEKTFPTPEECTSRRVERQAAQIRDAMGSLVFEAYLPTARALLQRPDGDVLIAAALRAFFQWDRSRRAEMGGDVEAEEVVETIVPARSLRSGRDEMEDQTERGERKDRGERADPRGRGDRVDRKERGERRDRGDRTDRKDRERRGKKPSEELNIDDLDALLFAADDLFTVANDAEGAGPNSPGKKRESKRKTGDREKGRDPTGEKAMGKTRDSERSKPKDKPARPGRGRGASAAMDPLDAALASLRSDDGDELSLGDDLDALLGVDASASIDELSTTDSPEDGIEASEGGAERKKRRRRRRKKKGDTNAESQVSGSDRSEDEEADGDDEDDANDRGANNATKEGPDVAEPSAAPAESKKANNGRSKPVREKTDVEKPGREKAARSASGRGKKAKAEAAPAEEGMAVDALDDLDAFLSLD